MRIRLHKNFEKNYNKLRASEKKKLKERRDLFFEDTFYLLLNNHALQGKYKGCRSINITGNLRVIYILESESVAYFVTIDTHNKLYI